MCMIAFLVLGCSASRVVCFTSEPPGALVSVSSGIEGRTPCLLDVPAREHRAVLSLPTGERREVCLPGKSGHDAQPRFMFGRAASKTCRILAAPLLFAGAAGLWYVERSSEDEDDQDHKGSSNHQKREVCLFSIGSFLAGSIFYYTGQNLDNVVPSKEPTPQIHVIFSGPESLDFR
ncbi:MAG: hypothetical protein AB1847_22260 [bacterium]